MDIFVYYRVYSEHTEKCYSSISAMQKQLRINLEIQTDLKCRVNQDDKNPTWMEIYRRVPEEFISVLDQAVIAAKVDTFIEGSRHIEVFEDI